MLRLFLLLDIWGSRILRILQQKWRNRWSKHDPKTYSGRTKDETLKTLKTNYYNIFLIQEHGGVLKGSITKQTINVLIGPFSCNWAQRSKQESFDCYDPKLVTDSVAIGAFNKDEIVAYKYTGKFLLIFAKLGV